MSKRQPVIVNEEGEHDVRQSAIGQYTYCPASLGGTSDHPTPATTFGTAFHAYPEALAQPVPINKRALIERPDPREAVLDALRLDGWSWQDTGLDESVLDAMADELLIAWRIFDDQIKPWIPWGDVQAEVQLRRRLSVDSAMAPVYLTGTPDLVYEEGHAMWDWKTSARGWHETRPSKEWQARLYPWLMGWEGTVHFHYVVYDRQNMTFEYFTVTTEDQEREDWAEAARRIAMNIVADFKGHVSPPYKVISDGFVAKRNWFCKPDYCPAWNTCAGKYMFDDGSVDLNAPRLASWVR